MDFAIGADRIEYRPSEAPTHAHIRKRGTAVPVGAVHAVAEGHRGPICDPDRLVYRFPMLFASSPRQKCQRCQALVALLDCDEDSSASKRKG